MAALSAEDQAVVAALRRDGAAVLRNLLTPEELTVARRDQEATNRDAFENPEAVPFRGRVGVDPGQPATNTGLNGYHMGLRPGLARCYGHPRLVAVARAALQQEPYLHMTGISRYTAGFAGLPAHFDVPALEFIQPWTRVAMHVFLDDIGEDSGAFEFLPTSHRLHFADDEGQPDQHIAGKGSTAPAKGAEVAAHAAGAFSTVTLSAGSVLLWHSAVWHAVRPVHRLRRCT